MGSSLSDDVDYVPSELGLDHPEVAGVVTEAEVFERLDHLTASEPSEIPSLTGGRAGRTGPGKGGEIGSLHDLVVDVLGFGLGLDKDVRCAYLLNHTAE